MKKNRSLSISFHLSISAVFLMGTMIVSPSLAGSTGGRGAVIYSNGGKGGNGNDGGNPPTAGADGDNQSGIGGNGGAAGEVNGGNGINGGDATGSGKAGGGGGGGGNTTIFAGSTINSLLIGGNGGNGGIGLNRENGGGAGGGGDGAIISGDITINANIRGGNGGSGGSESGSGGDGGGGAGMVMVASGTVTNNSLITGGNSGIGTNAAGGGAGAIFTTVYTILNNSSTGSITGGKGIRSGAGVLLFAPNMSIYNEGTITGGDISYPIGGEGGVGISVISDTTITNTGSIKGGNGQSGGYYRFGLTAVGCGEGSGGAVGVKDYADSEDYIDRIMNVGGAGIEARGGNVTVVTSGSIAGGSVGYDATLGREGISNAITFRGDNNTLELQNGFSFAGDVVCIDSSATNNKLVLGGTVPSTFDVTQWDNNKYQGFNIYQKNGSNTWTLSNSTSLTVPWTINDGELYINGDFSAPVVTIMPGAQLTSVGTINFNNANGVYTYEVDSLGNAGRINADIAQLGGDIHIIPQDGDYSAGITYTIVEAGTSVMGTFNKVTGASSSLEYKLKYGVNRVELTVGPLSSPFKNIVKEGNMGLMAQYINSLGNLPPTSTLQSFVNAITPLSTAEVQEALNQLHPGPNNSVSSSVMTDQFNRMDNVMSFSFTDRNSSLINTQLNGIGVAFNQLTPQVTPINRSGRSRGDGHFGKPFRFSELYIEGAANNPSMSQPMRTTVGGTTLWVQQTGSYSNQESMADGSSTIGIAGVKSTLTDTSVGADTLVAENLRLGATVGYGKTLYQLRQGYGKGRINTYRLGLYGIWQLAKNWYINVSAFWGCQDFKGKRTLTLTGVKHTNSQSHKGYNVGAMAEVGRDVALTKELTLTPYAGLGGLGLHEDQYSEKAEGLNPGLTVHKHNNHLIQGKTGIQMSQVFKINEVAFYFYGKLGYTYRKHLQNSHRIRASFTGYSRSFMMVTPNKAINMVNPGIGGSVLLARNLSLTGNYNAELSSKLHIHQATLNLTYRF